MTGLARRAIGAAVVSAALAWAGGAAAQDYAAQRARLIDTIRAHAADPQAGAPGGRISERVLQSLATVPRHEFVPERYRRLAYTDRALPIGEGQTISQPYIVALMTELLHVGADAAVLEVGTGSGYQAAVLSGLVRAVYTIEIVGALARRAAADLARLGYRNVTVKAGDGYKGWPEHAPFDGIIVTAAARQVPTPLIEQLKAGGRLVMPLEGRGGHQSLVVVEKSPDGTVVRRDVIPVLFVPMTREPR